MAYHIEKREGRRGVKYRVKVTIFQDGKLFHRESQTFGVRRDAESWGASRDKKLQKALDDPETFAALIAKPEPVSRDRTTFGSLVERYMLTYGGSFGRTVLADMDKLSRSDLAKKEVALLRSSDYVEHIRTRIDQDGIGPATGTNDLIRINVVLDAACDSWDVDVRKQIEELNRARKECRRRRMIGKAKERDRLPTDEELEKLYAHFERGDGLARIPMAEIIRFAIASTRRQDEITQLRWDDCDEKTRTGIVPRLKDPGGSRLCVKFKFTEEAWEIAVRQPTMGDNRIFPYEARSISSAFTRACKVLGIRDLHFHDLRHLGITRLFLMGYGVHEVAMFSLHRSWATLKRYTQLKPEDIVLRPKAA